MKETIAVYQKQKLKKTNKIDQKPFNYSLLKKVSSSLSQLHLEFSLTSENLSSFISSIKGAFSTLLIELLIYHAALYREKYSFVVLTQAKLTRYKAAMQDVKKAIEITQTKALKTFSILIQ